MTLAKMERPASTRSTGTIVPAFLVGKETNVKQVHPTCSSKIDNVLVWQGEEPVDVPQGHPHLDVPGSDLSCSGL